MTTWPKLTFFSRKLQFASPTKMKNNHFQAPSQKFIASTELRELTVKRRYGYSSHKNVTLNSSITDIKIMIRSTEIKEFSQSSKNPTSINVSLNPSKNFKKNMVEKLTEKANFRRKTLWSPLLFQPLLAVDQANFRWKISKIRQCADNTPWYKR